VPFTVDEEEFVGFSRVCGALFPEEAFSCSGEEAGYEPLFGLVPYGDWIQDSWEWARREAGWLVGEEDELGRPESGVLACAAKAMGLKVDKEVLPGGMQLRITIEIEHRRHAVLNREFLALNAGDVRRVAWLNVDSFSSQWVSSWMAEGPLSNMEFEYISGTYMGLPLPMFESFDGQKFWAAGREYTMDKYGHSLMAANLRGGSWLVRHDAFLRALRDAMAVCGVKVELEPQGLFRSCLSTPELRCAFSDLQSSRRGNIVPDAAIAIAFDDGGAVKPCLVEVKIFNVCHSWYPAVRDCTERKSGVHRREVQVLREYDRKARDMDTSLARWEQGRRAELGGGGVGVSAGPSVGGALGGSAVSAGVRSVGRESAGDVGGSQGGERGEAGASERGVGGRSRRRRGADGPISRRLRELGPIHPVCAGAFGEMSNFVNTLVEVAAEVGAEEKWRKMRCNDHKHCKAILLPMLKRLLGMAALVGNARCAVARLGVFDISGGCFGDRPRASAPVRRLRDAALDHFGCRRAVWAT